MGESCATGRPRSVTITVVPAAACATTADAFCFNSRMPTVLMCYTVALALQPPPGRWTELHADAIITGIGINILASGTTAFLIFTILGDKGGTSGLASGTLPRVTLPIIEDIPVLGPLISGQSVLTYLAFVALVAVTWMLYRTRFGYHLRALGEARPAAILVGIRPRRVAYSAMALSGALAGAGGVFLSMAAVSFFLREMTAGRGYIALAAVFLGGVRPVGAFVAALLFGAAEAIAIQLGGANVPSQVVTAVPYVITLVALGFAAARARQLRSGSLKPRGPLRWRMLGRSRG